ncbi:MAG TPA: hypothetical protein VK623_12555 [Flavobacterium sp.]|nr:hypothetical protein [Flavobacterium sp.]
MKFRFLYLSVLIFALVSCNNDDEKRNLENARDLKKKEAVFANIQKAWNFNARPVNPTAGSLAVNWAEWRIFLGELSQKPTSTIGAFRKKAKTLSLKAKDLNNHIPMAFNKPEIKARIAVLSTKINSLNLFVNVDAIPDKKVIALISEINIELASLQMQMDEIVRKSKIPKEEGESDMLKMLDTSRAIPNKPKPDPALRQIMPSRTADGTPILKTNK